MRIETIHTVMVKLKGFDAETSRAFSSREAAAEFVSTMRQSPLVEGVDDPFIGVVHSNGRFAAEKLLTAVEDFKAMSGGAEG